VISVDSSCYNARLFKIELLSIAAAFLFLGASRSWETLGLGNYVSGQVKIINA